MSEGREDICIEISPGETRVAFLDDRGRLLELIVERGSRPSRLDGVYLGRVVGIEKGLGAAFVDIGLEEAAFLDRAAGLHEGQSVMVQVMRDAAGGKAPAVRRRITVAGRYLAFIPGGEGVSWPRGAGGGGRQREEIETRLSSIVREGEGWAVRTRAIATAAERLTDEADRLRQRWTAIEGAARSATAPAVLVPAPTAIERILRDRAGDGMVVIDDRQAFLEAGRLVARDMPDLKGALAYHDAPEPLFEASGIEEQIEAAIEPTVDLPRRGRLVIETTEAMTVIDVDMGAAGERRRAEDAILSVNLAAAAEIARQVRLRNIAGLIVADFITMRGKGHRRQLVDAQRRGFRGSPVPVDVLGMTAAGLIEITRRRDGPALSELLAASEPPRIRFSRESVACAALRAVLRTRGAGRISLVAGQEVVSFLQGPLRDAYEEVDRRVGGALSLEIDPDEANFRVETGRRSK